MIRIVILVFIAALGGCSRQAPDISPTGQFALESRDGRALPAPIRADFGDGRECLNELLSATLTIRADGTWSETMRFQFLCGSSGSEITGPRETTSHGNIVLDAANPHSFSLVSRELEDGQTQIATVDRDELNVTFRVEGADKTHTFRYRRRNNAVASPKSQERVREQ